MAKIATNRLVEGQMHQSHGRKLLAPTLRRQLCAKTRRAKHVGCAMAFQLLATQSVFDRAADEPCRQYGLCRRRRAHQITNTRGAITDQTDAISVATSAGKTPE